MTVSQRSRFITPKAIRKISDRTEGALTRRTRHRGIKTAKKLIKGPVWEQCRSLPRIYPSLWRTSTGTVQMPAGVAPTDSPALNFLSSALATAAVLNLGDAKPDLHRQFDDLGAGGGGQGGLQFHSHRTSEDDTVLEDPQSFVALRLFLQGCGSFCPSARPDATEKCQQPAHKSPARTTSRSARDSSALACPMPRFRRD